MTNNTIFFMVNHEINPLQVTEIELIITHIDLRNGKDTIMNIYLLHTGIYPYPIAYVTIYDGSDFRFSYIDMVNCKYLQPVVYDTGEIVDKISILTEEELEYLDECIRIPSSLYGTTYAQILQKTCNNEIPIFKKKLKRGKQYDIQRRSLE